MIVIELCEYIVNANEGDIEAVTNSVTVFLIESQYVYLDDGHVTMHVFWIPFFMVSDLYSSYIFHRDHSNIIFLRLSNNENSVGNMSFLFTLLTPTPDY